MRHAEIITLILLIGAGLGFAAGWSDLTVMMRGIAVLVWLGALAVLYYLLAGVSVLAVFVRATLALLPIGGVAVGVIYALLAYAGLSDGEERAIVAAIVVAAGWVVAFVTTEWRKATEEQERRRDMIRAALTEVELIARLVRSIDWDARMTDMRQAFFKDSRYQVFVMYGHYFETLRRLTVQIEILSKAQIRPVMELVQLLERLEKMEAHMMSEAFTRLGSARRLEGVLRYLRMQKALPGIADTAAGAMRNRPFHGWLRHLK